MSHTPVVPWIIYTTKRTRIGGLTVCVLLQSLSQAGQFLFRRKSRRVKRLFASWLYCTERVSERRDSPPRPTGMCMIANEIQRDEEVSADVTTKDPAPGYAQGLQSSTGEGSLAVDEHGPHEEVVKTTVLKYAAEHRARAVPLSPEGKQGDSSVVVDKKRVAAAAVGEGAPCTSKKATPSKQRIQVIVRIRPIHPGAARYHLATKLPDFGTSRTCRVSI